MAVLEQDQDKGHLSKTMTADSVMAAATRETGLTDFGDMGFRRSLDEAVKIAKDMDFTPEGLTGFRAGLVRHLVNRLRYQADLERYPEILSEDVSNPIIVLGFPRSGTTKLQRMLSANPCVIPTWTWRMFNPAPFPGEMRGDPAPRIEWARTSLERAAVANPNKQRIHEFGANEAEEDGFILLGSFDYIQQYIVTPSRNYLEWVRNIPRGQSLGYLKSMLQYLQWQDGGKRGRHWLLKNTGHIGSLSEVLNVFPNATFIMSMRNLCQTMGSYCQMMLETYERTFKQVDPLELGRDALDYWGYELRRYQAARAELGDDIRMVSVPYTQLLNDIEGVTEEAYALHGTPLTEVGRMTMRAWARDHPQYKHGKFEYSLERFGLSAEYIRRAFGPIADNWEPYT
jgi:hypothetical protein